MTKGKKTPKGKHKATLYSQNTYSNEAVPSKFVFNQKLAQLCPAKLYKWGDYPRRGAGGSLPLYVCAGRLPELAIASSLLVRSPHSLLLSSPHPSLCPRAGCGPLINRWSPALHELLRFLTFIPLSPLNFIRYERSHFIYDLDVDNYTDNFTKFLQYPHRKNVVFTVF